MFDRWKSGEDVRLQIITKLADPDAVDKQQERYSIDNVWLIPIPRFATSNILLNHEVNGFIKFKRRQNAELIYELPLINYEHGAVIEEEIAGGFTPSEMINLDKIV